MVKGDKWDIDPESYRLQGVDPEITNHINFFAKALGTSLDRISVNFNQVHASKNILDQILKT